MKQQYETLGMRFVRSGLGMLILGMVMGLCVVVHYMIGARYDNSPAFLQNVGLWFGCPWTLSASMVMVGAIGMIAIGAAYMTLAGMAPAQARGPGDLSRKICKGSLVAIFLLGFIGYFIVDRIWPGFYYSPIKAGKETWLTLQLLCMFGYLGGVIAAFNGVRRLDHAAA